jgi:NADP-dependent 3-hydroxy acid dehydrogenase YdfG
MPKVMMGGESTAGKVAIVTRADIGISEGVQWNAFAAESASVIVVDRRENLGKEAVQATRFRRTGWRDQQSQLTVSLGKVSDGFDTVALILTNGSITMSVNSNAPARRPYALVTGASSGLGIELARQLAARGHDLVLAARSELPMRKLADEIVDAHGVAVRVESIDLSTPGSAVALRDRLDEENIDIDVLVNNAGFGLKRLFC